MRLSPLPLAVAVGAAAVSLPFIRPAHRPVLVPAVHQARPVDCDAPLEIVFVPASIAFPRVALPFCPLLVAPIEVSPATSGIVPVGWPEYPQP